MKEFWAGLKDKIKNKFIKKSDDNVIIEKNYAKIENSDNKKKNEKVSIETMKNEFDKLSSQINEFVKKFNSSQNNANTDLFEIIKRLYLIHNNLIEKIRKIEITTGLRKQNFKDMKEECEYTIFCDDSNLTELNKKNIEDEVKNEKFKTILKGFEKLKSIIKGLNVNELRKIEESNEIEFAFNSLFDKGKNEELENMKKNILDSLENLCKITYDELMKFFVNIFLAKKAIKIEEKRKKKEEEERRKKEEEEKKIKELEKKQKTEEQKKLSELIDKFLEKYPLNFNYNYNDATDDFYNIFKGIMKMRGYSDYLLKNYEWNVKFDDNGNLSKESAGELGALYALMFNGNGTKGMEFLYDELKIKIEKFLEDIIDLEKLKKYFKDCYSRPKEIEIQEEQKLKQVKMEEEQKEQQKEQNEALQEVKKLLLKNGSPKENIQKYQNECKNIKTEFESNEEISETLKKYYYIYLDLYNFLSRVDSKAVGKKLKFELNNNELNYKLECFDKLKKWFRMILDKINSKDKSLKDIKKLFEKSNLKILFGDLSNKNFSINKILGNIENKKRKNLDKLKEEFIEICNKNAKDFFARYCQYTNIVKIFDFFNIYYKFYDYLYNIYKYSQSEKKLDKKIEYDNYKINIDDLSNEYIIKEFITKISNNLSKFKKIKEWFKSNNENLKKMFENIEAKDRQNVVQMLFNLKFLLPPTDKDVEKIKKQQFSEIKWD